MRCRKKTGYLSFSLADIGQNRIQQDTVIKVPVATANVICSILVVSNSPLFADPSRTTIMKMIMKHKLEALFIKNKYLDYSFTRANKCVTCCNRRSVPVSLQKSND